MRYTWDYLRLHVWRRDYISLVNMIVLFNMYNSPPIRNRKDRGLEQTKYNCNIPCQSKSDAAFAVTQFDRGLEENKIIIVKLKDLQQ